MHVKAAPATKPWRRTNRYKRLIGKNLDRGVPLDIAKTVADAFLRP